MTIKEKLIRTIRHGSCKEKRNEAAQLLLNQNPTNYELSVIILYTDKRNEAAELLLKQNPTDTELVFIITSTDRRNEAAAQLLKWFGVNENMDEELLIKEIAKKVLDNPDLLDMDMWHCGTSHCLAGWATVINPIAKMIEEKTTTEMAGCAVLPNYAHLFYSNNETVLEVLKEKLV